MKSLLLDIETTPLTVYTWGIWQQNAIKVIKHSEVICFTAKWLGGPKITKALSDYSSNREAELLAELWILLDQADIVIAHNGDQFDLRRINTRFAKYGLLAPSQYRTVDTLKLSKRTFGFPSNSLRALCEYLGLGTKLSTGGIELWEGCMVDDPKAWDKMKKYNAHDVRLLESLYNVLIPWIDSNPKPARAAERNCLKSLTGV